jgi:hypothetical protein
MLRPAIIRVLHTGDICPVTLDRASLACLLHALDIRLDLLERRMGHERAALALDFLTAINTAAIRAIRSHYDLGLTAHHPKTMYRLPEDAA